MRNTLHKRTNKLSDILNSKKKNRPYSSKGPHVADGLDFIHLVKAWPELVGELLGKYTLPIKIMHGKLIVITKHPSFAQELSFMGPMIIEKINRQLPHFKNLIHNIYFEHRDQAEFHDFFHKLQEGEKKKKMQEQKLHPYSPQYRQLKDIAEDFFADFATLSEKDGEIKKMLISIFLQNHLNK